MRKPQQLGRRGGAHERAHVLIRPQGSEVSQQKVSERFTHHRGSHAPTPEGIQQTGTNAIAGGHDQERRRRAPPGEGGTGGQGPKHAAEALGQRDQRNPLYGAVDAQGIHDIGLASGHLQGLPHSQDTGGQQEMPYRQLLGEGQPGEDERYHGHAKRCESHQAAAIVAVGQRAGGQSHHKVWGRTDGEDGANHGFRVGQRQHHPAEDDLLHPQAEVVDHRRQPKHRHVCIALHQRLTCAPFTRRLRFCRSILPPYDPIWPGWSASHLAPPRLPLVHVISSPSPDSAPAALATASHRRLPGVFLAAAHGVAMRGSIA